MGKFSGMVARTFLFQGDGNISDRSSKCWQELVGECVIDRLVPRKHGTNSRV